MDVGLRTRRDLADPLSVALTGGVEAVYQPIVRLAGREIVGYEALVRGPRGTALESPASLFASARARGREPELHWECRRAALLGALRTGLDGGQALFVNVEPAFAGTAPPRQVESLLDEALGRFPVVLELTERALTDNPTELLALVDEMRARGARIALDDVGADPRSLALMPFLRPDVIKLDLALMQRSPSREIAEIVHAVNAEAEATGALVLAEGIETEEHLRRALALGASHGQGWLFGRPGELGRLPAAAADLPSGTGERLGAAGTPFEIISSERELRRGDKWLLLELSRAIEAHTASRGSAAVVLSTFQEARFFTQASASRYARLARDAALVAALGVGLPAEPEPGVRGVSLAAAEPLRGEWNVTVVAPHFSAAFVGRDLGDSGPDSSRRFDFALTYDRDLVLRAARSMMGRIAGLGESRASLSGRAREPSRRTEPRAPAPR